MRTRNTFFCFALIFILLCASVLIALAFGSVKIPLADLFNQQNLPILKFRALRIFTCLVVGSGLSVSGAVLQAILRNPLAEPYLLGTSSGAGLGAILAVIFGLGAFYMPLWAFAGALTGISLVYAMARQGNELPVQSLILSGVIISIAISGTTVLLSYLSPSEAIFGVMWWLWGSLQVYNPTLLVMVGIVVLLGTLLVYFFHKDLNALSIGEEDAIHLGIPAEKMKKVLILVTSLMTAAVVCVSGIIGFVGIIIPHATRLIFGPDHRKVIPGCVLLSGTFLVACDLLARTLITPSEIPIGVITALSGAPLFLFLLKGRTRL